MEALRGYLIAIVAACMLAAVAAAMVKNPALSRVVRFVSGVLIALVVVTPLLSLDPSALTQALSEIAGGERAQTQSMEEKYHAQLSAHIKRTTEAYIEAKAAELGAAVQARVTLSDEDYPQPVSARIIGTLDVEQTLALSAYMRDALGIAEGRQTWE